MKTINNYQISKGIVIFTIVMFAYSLMAPEAFYKFMILHSNQWSDVYIWQFITTSFYMPRSLFFFVFLVFVLYYFSTGLEALWGSKHFFIFVLITVLGKNISTFIFGLPQLGVQYSLYTTLLIAFGFCYPYEQIRLFFMIPIRVKYLAIFSMIAALYHILSAVSLGTQINQFALIPMPTNISHIIVILSQYLGVIIYFNKIFGHGHIRRISFFLKRNMQQVDHKIKTKVKAEKNKPYVEIYQKILQNQELSSSEKDLIDNIMIDSSDNLCEREDFHEDDSYCLSCKSFQKCIKREIVESFTKS